MRSRCAGSRSTRISSICATPRCLSSALARRQNGQTWVVYMRTVFIMHWSALDARSSDERGNCPPAGARPCTAAAVQHRTQAAADFSIGRLASRQALRPPASAVRVRSPSLAQQRRPRAPRARRWGTQHQRQRLVARQVLGALEAAQRHVARAGGVARGELVGLADVDQHRLLAVDQAHRLGGADRRRRRPCPCSCGHNNSAPEVNAARTSIQLSSRNFAGHRRSATAPMAKGANYRIRAPATTSTRPCTSSS